MNTDSPMKLLMDYDYATLECPCGASLHSQGVSDGEWRKFKEKHKPHTNGKLREICTSDGARAYGGEIPPSRESDL
jgi:hypothetical protein